MARYVGYTPPKDAEEVPEETELSHEDMQELAKVFGLPVRPPKK